MASSGNKKLKNKTEFSKRNSQNCADGRVNNTFPEVTFKNDGCFKSFLPSSCGRFGEYLSYDSNFKSLLGEIGSAAPRIIFQRISRSPFTPPPPDSEIDKSVLVADGLEVPSPLLISALGRKD